MKKYFITIIIVLAILIYIISDIKQSDGELTTFQLQTPPSLNIDVSFNDL